MASSTTKQHSHVLNCDFTGCQTGDQRFTTRPRGKPPTPRDDRVNLTVLSHVYNLYFVAVVDAIHVYQPNFPDQFLADEPDLIIQPPVSGPGLRHQIDRDCRHSVTRLHVDFLGNDEVILVACDDGDVIGYKTSHVQYEIGNISAPNNSNSDNDNVATRLRPFFHRNFLLSVWGLAVHREARLLAVSSNSRCITVIAFALAAPEDSKKSPTPPARELPAGAADFPLPRKLEHIFCLIASHNIPSVSFDNHGTDPQGRWLLSNVIDGNVFLWDLHHPASPARRIRLAFCAGTSNPKSPPRQCICPERGYFPHGAWSAIFVDPRSSQKCVSVEDALGSKATKDDEFFWDISPSADTSTDTQDAQSPQNPPVNTNVLAQVATLNGMAIITHNTGLTTVGQVLGLGQGQGGEDDADMSEIVESDAMSDTEEEYYQLTSQIHMASASPTTSLDTPVLLPGHNGPDSAYANLLNWIQTSNLSYIGGHDVIGSSENHPALLGGLGHTGTHSLNILNAMRNARKKPFFESNRTNTLEQNAPAPSVPIMIVCKHDVFLLQPLSSENSYEGGPIVAMNDPLLTVHGRIAPFHDRLCFTTEIPELGIVLVGSPVGRVAILTLTHTRKSKRGKTIYGYRYDPSRDLLPLAAQRQAYPQLGNAQTRLVGMATSPMQGMQGSSKGETSPTRVHGSRRWRLILYYQNNTILSYELSWCREESGAILSTLVV